MNKNDELDDVIRQEHQRYRDNYGEAWRWVWDDDHPNEDYIECECCGKVYRKNSIKMNQCEYCDEFYCNSCYSAHKREIHNKD